LAKVVRPVALLQNHLLS